MWVSFSLHSAGLVSGDVKKRVWASKAMEGGHAM
jgi:hypothetical protein